MTDANEVMKIRMVQDAQELAKRDFRMFKQTLREMQDIHFDFTTGVYGDIARENQRAKEVQFIDHSPAV